MKKVLSLLLAVVMVIGICPTFLFSAFAASDKGEESEPETFPELVITEIYANAINYCTNAPTWLQNWPKEAGFYSAPQPNDPYYLSLREFRAGETLPSGTYKKVTAADGTVSFESVSGGAEAGASYFAKYDTASYYDSFQYMEVYNSGTKPINLYDYRLVYDSSSTYNEQRAENNPVKMNDIKPGAVKSSYRRDGFERIAVEVGTSLAGYYTKDGDSFIPCAADAVAEEGVEYYHTFGEDGTYFVTNPEEAILQPGQCAVLWFYTDIDQICGAKMSYFRQFFETETASKAYKLDMSNTLVLCVDANSVKNLSGYSCDTSVNFKIVLGNHVRYGIVPGDYENRIDNNYSNWISSVRWDCYAGFNESLAVTRASVVVGETVVTSGYFYIDEQTGYYTLPKNNVGADENGKAKDGVAYYKINLASTNYAPTGSNSPVSHKLDRTSTNFLYGFDSALYPNEGAAYTVSQYDNTPGMLTEAQKATLPNGTQKTSAPKLVITEVMPDSEGADLFEYVEVVNTSGETINIFDYTFVARSSSYMASSNEFFNKANPLIPGDVGNILSAEPGAVFNDVVPTNIDYKSGWLEPGEVVVLWSYYADSAKAGVTFDDFYNYYNLDRSVKVIAMDSDCSAYSGRSLRQNLGNSGSYLYGLAANSNLDFYGEVYKSNPVMKPITYANGVTSTNNTGIPISDCESFVVAACVFATCSSVPGLGENYGYQYIWNKNPGVNNKCGAYYSYARLTQMSNDSKFTFTGSVVTEEWKASPGKLLPRQKTELTMNTGNERYVLYSQDFENLGTVSGYDAVSKLLGISAYDEKTNATLTQGHNANLAAAENGTNSLLEINDGKLYVKNRGTADEYLRLMADDILKNYRKTNFTIEYSMSYSADSTNGNGYSAILFDFDPAKMSYGEPAIRISGYGSNSVYLNGERFSIEDDPTTPHAAPSMSAVSGSGTLYEKLTGNAPAGSLENSKSLAGVTIKVRIEVSYTNGVTVYVNDTEVSETKRVASSKAFADWAFFLEESNGTELALKTTAGTEVAYDYITIYSDTLGTNAKDLDLPALFITEVLLSGGSQYYTPNASSTTNLSWLEYIELTNGSDQPVSLMDYTLVRNSKEDVEGGLYATYSHQGNNRTWDPMFGNNGYCVAKLSDWLGRGDKKANVSYSAGGLGTENSVYNPSENEAVLQPGESIVILTLNDGAAASFYQKTDKNGATVNVIDATRSWLNMPSNAKVMVIGQAALYKSVDGSAAEQLNNAFGMWDSESFIYGVARNKGTYYDGTTYELNPGDWKDIYTHDYRKLESLLDLNMSVAFGQNNNSANGSDYGSGGESVAGAGWVAYYLYGDDNTMHYKYGIPMSRRNARPFDAYSANSTTVSAKGDYNAGKLLAAQQKSFEEMNKLRNGNYAKDASLVVTEFIPGTTDDRGGVKNAFESAEITNIGTTPVNLYQYALVESPVTYGCTGVWNVMNPFTAGTPVGQNHKWYNRVKYLQNPETCIVEPGESVVIWNYYSDTYNLADMEPKRDYISMEDFRNFWASQGNPLINQYDLVEEPVTDAAGNQLLDENGTPVTRTVKKYKVKVIVVVGNDGGITPSFNFANNGTASIGICRKNTISVSGSIRATDVLSYTTNALHSAIFNLAITRTQITKNTYAYNTTTSLRNWSEDEIELVDFSGILYTGDPVYGYYTSTNCHDFTPCGEFDVAQKGKYYYKLQEDGTYLPVLVNENISVEDYFVKSRTSYSRASGTHAGRTYTQVTRAAGESVTGLFMQIFVDVYTQCHSGALAVAGTTYYTYADGAYTEATVETGTIVSGLYTKSEITEYEKCDEGTIAEENVTYYEKNGRRYTAVEGVVAGVTDVSAYYTAAMKDVYTLCPAIVAVAGVTYYEKNGEEYTVAEVKTPTDVSEYFTKRSEERRVACAEDAVAEEGKIYYSVTVPQYYKLYFYVNQQTQNANDEGLNWAFNFVYGTSVSGSWSIGTMLQTTKVTKRTRGGSVLSSKTPDFIPKVSVEIASRGVRQNSLGYLIEEQLGMVASLRFTEAASLADGTRVYVYDTVKQDLSDVTVNMLGASVDRTEAGTTVAFSAAIAEEIVRALEARFGAENVSVGMITARAEALLASGANLRELELSGAYTPVKGLSVVTVLPENCYQKAYRDIFVKCAADAVAKAGVTYYELVNGAYVAVENVETGTPLEGLFTKGIVDVYTRCGYYDLFKEGVTYYEKQNDDSYTVVANAEVGKSANGYYTKSTEERYTACEGGVVEAGVTYYTVDEAGNYTEATVVLPQSVAEYYLADKEPIYALCEAGTYAEPGVIYYAKNADGEYVALPKAKIVSKVSGYYVKNGEDYVACGENSIAVSGVTYYEKNGEEYIAVTDLVTVDTADGLYVLNNGVYTKCAAGKYVLAGVTYYTPVSFAVDERLEGIADGNGNLVYTGSAITMQKNYYKDTYSAIAYIKVHTETQDYYFYASQAISRSVVQVLYTAMNDVSNVRTDAYCYEVGDGTYSRYTAAQRKQFEKLCQAEANA